MAKYTTDTWYGKVSEIQNINELIVIVAYENAFDSMSWELMLEFFIDEQCMCSKMGQFIALWYLL